MEATVTKGATEGGSGGATTGTGGSATNASGGTSGGGPTAGDGGMASLPACRRAAGDYVATTAEACLGLTFRCDPGAAAFADACGCGCDRTPFDETDGTPFEDVTVDCGGPSGVFAMFESTPKRLVIGEAEVFAWVETIRSGATVVWAIDKRTGGVRLLPAGTEPEPMRGAVVSDDESFESDGVRYSFDEPTLSADMGQGEILLDEACDFPAVLVVDSELYLTCENGALYRAFVAPFAAPDIVEQRGELDDDDYALMLGADPDAVYWLSGPYLDARVSDQDPLVLYRYCR
jgi:hypothetical protein